MGEVLTDKTRPVMARSVGRLGRYTLPPDPDEPPTDSVDSADAAHSFAGRDSKEHFDYADARSAEGVAVNEDNSESTYEACCKIKAPTLPGDRVAIVNAFVT